MATYRVLAAYLAAAVLLSSVSMVFEWKAPIDTPEGPWEWYRSVGVVNGVFVLGGHAAPGGGWTLEVYSPRFTPIPALSSVGPESAGLFVSVWFAFGCLALAHLGIRSATRFR
jgi:hypothetical protein